MLYALNCITYSIFVCHKVLDVVCSREKRLFLLLMCKIDFVSFKKSIFSWYARGKKGPGSPGTFKKVPGLLDFLSPGTTGPRDLQGL